jgi:transcriptional regulator with XRE-family HTH domain
MSHFNAGYALRKIIRNRDITMASIARRMDIKTQQVYRFTKSRDMKLSTAIRLCEIIGIPLAEFIEVSNGSVDSKQ